MNLRKYFFLKNFGYFLVAFLSVYLIVSVLYSALYAQIHTDEYWYIYKVRSFANNLDVFSHRLPLYDYIYGVYGAIFGGDILTLRILSVIFFLSSIFALLHFLVIAKKASQTGVLLATLLFCHPYMVEMAGTVTTYSLSVFLATIFIILLERGKVYWSIIPFLGLYLSRYIVDFLIFVFPAAAILSKEDKRAYFNLSILVFVLVFVLFANDSIVKNTFLFNLGVKDFQSELGIISDDFFGRFIYLRKLEFMAFYMLIPLIYLLIRNVEIKRFFSSKDLIYVISIFGGCAYYWLTVNDYPITKLIFIPFIAILASRISSNTLMSKVTIFIISIGFLYTPNLMPKNDHLIQTSQACEFVSCDSTSVLAINPIISSEFEKHVLGMPMELYSFAFDQEKSYDGLISSNAFVEMVKDSLSEVVIIDSRLKSRKNMSKVFSDQQYSDILHYLHKNYRLEKKYFDQNFGEDFFIYVRI